MNVLVEQADGRVLECDAPIAQPNVPSFWAGSAQFLHVREMPDGRWVYRPVGDSSTQLQESKKGVLHDYGVGIPVYKLQIVDAHDHHVVTFFGRGPVERSLITAVADAVLRKGTWWIRRKALRSAVEDSIKEVLVDALYEAYLKHGL